MYQPSPPCRECHPLSLPSDGFTISVIPEKTTHTFKQKLQALTHSQLNSIIVIISILKRKKNYGESVYYRTEGADEVQKHSDLPENSLFYNKTRLKPKMTSLGLYWFRHYFSLLSFCHLQIIYNYPQCTHQITIITITTFPSAAWRQKQSSNIQSAPVRHRGELMLLAELENTFQRKSLQTLQLIL